MTVEEIRERWEAGGYKGNPEGVKADALDVFNLTGNPAAEKAWLYAVKYAQEFAEHSGTEESVELLTLYYLEEFADVIHAATAEPVYSMVSAYGGAPWTGNEDNYDIELYEVGTRKKDVVAVLKKHLGYDLNACMTTFREVPKVLVSDTSSNYAKELVDALNNAGASARLI